MKGLFFGLTTIDIQYFVENFPKENTKIKTNAPEILVGGPATNAAIAFAALNGESYLCSTVGQNEFLPFIESDFKENKVKWIDLIPPNTYHPAVLASVITNSNNGDRTIITHNPEHPVNPKDIDLIFKPYPDVLLLDGFYPETAVRLAQKARQNGIPVVFDGESWKPWLYELLPYIDYAICSENFMPPGCQKRNEIFQFLKTHGIINIAITRGEKSIIIYEKNQTNELFIDPVNDIEDTLGAGDIFHGAFCYFLLEKADFSYALKEAAKIAGFSCQYKGTRAWIQLLKSVKKQEEKLLF